MMWSVMLTCLLTVAPFPPAGQAVESGDEAASDEAGPEDPAPAPVMPKTVFQTPRALPVTMALSGAAAALAVAATMAGHVCLAVPMSVLSVCPVLGCPWMLYVLVGYPCVVAEAAAWAGQAVAGKVGRRRVPNLMLAAGAIPWICGAAILSGACSLGVMAASVAVNPLWFPGGMRWANILLMGLVGVQCCINVGGLATVLGGVGTTVGVLAGLTGRPLQPGEDDLHADWLTVPKDALDEERGEDAEDDPAVDDADVEELGPTENAPRPE